MLCKRLNDLQHNMYVLYVVLWIQVDIYVESFYVDIVGYRSNV